MPEGDLSVGLDFPLPDSLRAGGSTAVLCYGSCFHPRAPVEALDLVVAGRRHPVRTLGMPRPDRFASLHPGLSATELGEGNDPASAADPELRSFRSGFWATIALTAPPEAGAVEIGAEARLAGGGLATAALGEIPIIERATGSSATERRVADGLIAVCMATFEPDLELLRAQLESLRGQTRRELDLRGQRRCSSPPASRRSPSWSGATTGSWSRARSSGSASTATSSGRSAWSRRRRGWSPSATKTTAGIRRSWRRCEPIGDAELAYSDQRLVDSAGEVIADTLWLGRRNNYTNLTSLLLANTVTGAATLFRREVAEPRLPFPQMPGWQFHDHWIGLVALARGRIAYVDRPLYDYVQHRGAILGQVAVDSAGSSQAQRPRLRSRLEQRLRGWFRGWRPNYFCGYLRLEVQAQTLLARCGPELDPGKRRALERFSAADRSVLAFAILALRSARALTGRNETLGAESQLIRGLLWRRITAARSNRRREAVAYDLDASFPPCGPDSFGQRRMRRWRARNRRT